MKYTLLIALICFTYSKYAFDHELLHNVSNLVCMKQLGYDYAIFRAYRSYGIFDPVIVQNIKNAHEAGLTYVDVYLFPCISCGNPREQVNTMVDGLKNSTYGMVWVDIEIYQWTTNLTYNQQFILDMFDQLKVKNQTVGVYTSYHNWENIVGINWEGIKTVPLWYAHWDRSTNFSDFKPYGGWTKPVMKQFQSDGILCGMNVDQDYY